MFFALAGTLGLSLLILGLRLGALWGPFWCFFTALGPDPLFEFIWKRLEKGAKKKTKRSRNVCIHNGFLSRQYKSAFRLRQRERIEVQALFSLLRASIFAFPFLRCSF